MMVDNEQQFFSAYERAIEDYIETGDVDCFRTRLRNLGFADDHIAELTKGAVQV